MAKTYNQGLFKVHNKDKYIGNPDHIIYRSGWELKAFIALDNDPDVIKWGSEQIAIPYVSPLDRRIHRYFPDLYVERRNKQDKSKSDIYIIEIKPKKETILPSSATTKSRRRLIKETLTYNVNNAKWRAAHAFCNLKRWKFEIHTEATLFGK